MVTLIRGKPSESFQITTVTYSDQNSGTILKLLCVNVNVHLEQLHVISSKREFPTES